MKLVWFGGGCFRLHYGGRIFLAGAADAEGVAESELHAGVDHELSTGGDADLKAWKPRRKARLIDDDGVNPAVTAFAGGGWAIEDGSEEALLVLPAGELANLTTRPGVLVVWGESAAKATAVLLANLQPGLIAIADPGLNDASFARIAAAVTESAVTVLERGLAVEA